jgi:hypothetical protein
MLPQDGVRYLVLHKLRSRQRWNLAMHGRLPVLLDLLLLNSELGCRLRHSVWLNRRTVRLILWQYLMRLGTGLGMGVRRRRLPVYMLLRLKTWLK